MTSEGDSLPPWAKHHEPAFVGLMRGLERVTGFILQPLETPSRDVDRLLAEWLTARGRPTHLVAPADAQAWRSLVADLRSIPRDPGRIVLVSGPSKVDADVAHGLAMVNLHRDGIARDLACPLLWCGDQDFLHSTWDRAPDFWSIASVVKRLPALALEPPIPTFEVSAEAGEIDFDELVRLHAAAREQGDVDNMVSLGIRLIGVMLANSQVEMARGMAEEINQLATSRIQLAEALRFMRYLERLGEPVEETRAAYHKILEQLQSSGPRSDEAQALLQLGILEHTSGRLPAARDAMRRAAEIFEALGEAEAEAVTLLQLAQADQDAGDVVAVEAALRRVEEALRRAPVPELRASLQLVRSQLLFTVEKFSEALETLSGVDTVAPGRPWFDASVEYLRGAILARLREHEGAQWHLTRALALVKAQGDRSAAMQLHRSLAALAVDAGDGEAAALHYDAAKFDGDARADVERELGLAIIANHRGDATLAALHAWEAYTLSTDHDPALAPAVRAMMLQLVRQAIGTLPDDDACAVIDRLIGYDAEGSPVVAEPTAEEREVLERAVARLRGTSTADGGID